MTLEDVAKIVFALLASVGGGGAIVLGLSGYLGKIWANRLMAREQAEHNHALETLRADLYQTNQTILEADRAKYNRELEELKAQLTRVNEENLSTLRAQVDVLKHSQIQEYQDKLSIYRLVGEIVADLLADFDVNKGANLSPKQQDRYNRRWMKAYGFLGMLAPQEVMNSFDHLNDYILNMINGDEVYEWAKIRELSLGFINQIRVDIGINKSAIEYRGEL